MSLFHNNVDGDISNLGGYDFERMSTRTLLKLQWKKCLIGDFAEYGRKFDLAGELS